MTFKLHLHFRKHFCKPLLRSDRTLGDPLQIQICSVRCFPPWLHLGLVRTCEMEGWDMPTLPVPQKLWCFRFADMLQVRVCTLNYNCRAGTLKYLSKARTVVHTGTKQCGQRPTICSQSLHTIPAINSSLSMCSGYSCIDLNWAIEENSLDFIHMWYIAVINPLRYEISTKANVVEKSTIENNGTELPMLFR